MLALIYLPIGPPILSLTMDWLSQNWFQAFTFVCLLLSWAVHWGISTQKWQNLRDAFYEFKDEISEEMGKLVKKIEQVENNLALHTSNTEIHVSLPLLQLFEERSQYSKQQFELIRDQHRRFEDMLTKMLERRDK